MTAFPDGWTTRRPTLDDVPAILAVTRASDIAAVGEPEFSTEDVREALTEANTDPARDSWLAVDPSGEVVGWAYPSNATGGDRDFAEVYVWPGRGLPAQRPLLALLLARMAERGAELGHKSYKVRAGAVPTEEPYIAALRDAGFVFNHRHARMRMSLDGVPATPPEPPEGVSIRPVRSGDEGEMRAFHGVIREAFRDTNHQGRDYESWRRQFAGEPTITWDEWLLAEVGDTIVGALQSADGADGDEGWVRRLAVLRDHRRRGVGEALLRWAFATYVRHGRPKAGLGVDMQNPTRAIRLYRAVGMTPLYEADVFEKVLDLG